MRKDRNLDTDVKRIPTLAWLFFLKCFDDLERQRGTEAVLKEKILRSSIEKPYRWRDWAADEAGITGDELLDFINNELFPYLKGLTGTTDHDQRDVISALFQEITNEARSGYLLRDVINLVNKINFNSLDDIHTLSHIYESMLRELRDAAGQNGEFYTPRPVVRFIVEMIAPKLGETILDPAGGTCGFLVETYEYLKKQQKKAEDRDLLQYRTLYGIEKKPMPYLLGTMNLLLHGIERPNYTETNSLAVNLNDITDSRRYDIIITNPPFGGEEETGVKSGFPQDKQTSETALLFLQFIMRSLRRPNPAKGIKGGRCGMVVPNGTLFGGGVCARIKQELIENFNFHTIVRLPKGVFEPYADIETNLLFFEQNGPTKEIWYYEIPLPEGRKQYTKTKPMKFEEFRPVLEWWNNREENEHTWKVPMKQVVKNSFNLDIKNPRRVRVDEYVPPEKVVVNMIKKEERIFEQVERIQEKIHVEGTMKGKWRQVKLEEILRHSREPVEINSLMTYKQITVKLHHKGVILRGERAGEKIKSKQYLAKMGQFIISRIDARNGAMGLVPPELDRAIVTNDFLTYDINKKEVFPKYFDYLTSTMTFVRECVRASEGTTNRVRLKPDRFLAIEIPLPSLEEQRRIVSLLEEVGELNKLHSETRKELDALTQSILSKAFRGEL